MEDKIMFGNYKRVRLKQEKSLRIDKETDNYLNYASSVLKQSKQQIAQDAIKSYVEMIN